MFIQPKLIYKQNEKYKSEFYFEFNENGFTSKVNDATSDIQWSFYSSYIENDNFILLYYAKNCFTFFPKSIFKTNHELNYFLDIIHNKLQHKD